jgi:epoxyqueuosine reductase
MTGKYHSTISRRDFLKILGLGGAGVAASIGIPPVFHDLEEVMASPIAEFKRPSYVKEVDKPTVEIDWNGMKRFDYSEVMWTGGLRKAVGPEQWEKLFRVQSENRIKWINENRPGYTLRDDAFLNCDHWAPITFLGPQTTQTPEQLGVPRFEGTPEDNARMIRAFLRFHGAALVGFVELERNTTEKLLYSYDSKSSWPWGNSERGRPFILADVDKPLEQDGALVIPNKARWIIVYTLRMSDEVMRWAPTQLSLRSTYVMYNLRTLIQGQLQNFLRGLGYMGIGATGPFNSLGTSVGFAVMAGLGEQCRVMHLMTPEYGLRQRVFVLATDMPLDPGKPIDFGVMRFCRVCKKCADFCPAQAISHDTEPSWDIRGPYNNPGVRIWRRLEPACNSYQVQSGYGEGCSVCFAVCPLSKGNRKAFYHDIMRTTISNTPVFDRAFRKMDDFLGYGIRNDPEKFWDLDLPPFGWE